MSYATCKVCVGTFKGRWGMETHGRVVQLPGRSGFRDPQPLDDIGDLFDRPNARVFVLTSGNPRNRVVADPGLLRDDAPRSIALEGLQGGLDLLESHAHAPMLGVRALDVKARAHKVALHHLPMGQADNTQEEAPSVFVQNLTYLIGDSSVNAWAKAHGLGQTTIQRLLDGSDPKLPMLEAIAEKTGIQPWQLLAPGLGEGLHWLDGRSLVPVTRPTRRPDIGDGGAGRRRSRVEEVQPELRRKV